MTLKCWRDSLAIGCAPSGFNVQLHCFRCSVLEIVSIVMVFLRAFRKV